VTVMKITTFDSNTIKESYLKRSETDAKSTRKDKTSISKNDSVSISEDALALSEAENKNTKVESIKSSIENGTYKIAPKVIAEKILSGFEPLE